MSSVFLDFTHHPLRNLELCRCLVLYQCCSLLLTLLQGILEVYLKLLGIARSVVLPSWPNINISSLRYFFVVWATRTNSWNTSICSAPSNYMFWWPTTLTWELTCKFLKISAGFCDRISAVGPVNNAQGAQIHVDFRCISVGKKAAIRFPAELIETVVILASAAIGVEQPDPKIVSNEIYTFEQTKLINYSCLTFKVTYLQVSA